MNIPELQKTYSHFYITKSHPLYQEQFPFLLKINIYKQKEEIQRTTKLKTFLPTAQMFLMYSHRYKLYANMSTV